MEYGQSNFRYMLKLSVASNDHMIKLSLFGKTLETVFGMEVNRLVRYLRERKRLLNWSREESSRNLLKALEYCLCNNWYFFNMGRLKDGQLPNGSDQYHVAKSIRIPCPKVSEQVTLYDYFKFKFSSDTTPNELKLSLLMENMKIDW